MQRVVNKLSMLNVMAPLWHVKNVKHVIKVTFTLRLIFKNVGLKLYHSILAFKGCHDLST
jgi:hypothetical protein